MNNSFSQYHGKLIAITGASGYLASVLVDALLGVPAHILRVSRQVLSPVSGTATLKADIRSIECWHAIVSEADIIFHLAGNTSVYAAAQDPVESLNSTALPITCLVAAAQAASRRPRVVFASTATIYGLTNEYPVSENIEPKPVTNYDLHKLFAERQLKLASEQGKLEGVSLRLANIYGPSPSRSSADDRGILNKVTRMALQGENLTLYGDGNYLRDYIYIDDVIRAFMVAGIANGITGQSFNIATGKSTTVREAFQLVAEQVEQVTGNRIQIKNTHWPTGADPIEFRNFGANITNIQNSTNWRPTIGLKQGIDMMIEYFSRKIV